MSLRSKEEKMTIFPEVNNRMLRSLKQANEANKLHDINAALSQLHEKITASIKVKKKVSSIRLEDRGEGTVKFRK